MTTPTFDLAEIAAAVNEVFYESGWCQRTTDRVHSWRHVSEGGFDRSRYGVAPIKHKPAVAFVHQHHYSGTYPAAKRRYGMFEGDELVGVLVLGTPMRNEVLTNPLPTLDNTTAAELSRLVLLDRVPANAESWFVGQVLRDAREQGLRGIVAFSDPVPRPDVGMPGHVGTTYQAGPFDYCGRATARDLTVLPTGVVLTDRALQKVRGTEQGAGGVIRRIVDAGARPPRDGEAGAAWLRQALKQIRVRRVPHGGTHRFVWRPGSVRQQRMNPLGDGYEPRPYPKTPDPIPIYRSPK